MGVVVMERKKHWVWLTEECVLRVEGVEEGRGRVWFIQRADERWDVIGGEEGRRM